MTGRFAPTPSGRMHIGNVYAMLGAWLSARKSGDSIRLRIEDIDEPRVVPGAAETMMRDLEWLGLGWDDEPVFQSSRHALYQEALELLSKLSFDEINDIISTGSNDSKPCSTTAGNEAATSETTPLIYPCFCSRADIRAASAPQEGDRFTVYPGTCRRLIASEPQRAKQRLANNDRHSMRIATADTTITFHDEVFGTQQYNLAHDIGDIIVRRSDGIYSTSWPSPWTTSTWASPTLCAAVICFAPTLCKSTFAKPLSTRDSSLPNRHSPSILPTVPINLTM